MEEEDRFALAIPRRIAPIETSASGICFLFCLSRRNQTSRSAGQLETRRNKARRPGYVAYSSHLL
jgi:hypothetical protein